MARFIPGFPEWARGRNGGTDSAWIVLAFVAMQILCQLGLLSETIGQFRSGVRVLAFGSSLILLVVLHGQGPQHPSARPAVIALLIVVASLVHPNRNSLTAATGQVMMYLAILGPLFWVPRAGSDPSMLRRIMAIMWAYHAVSSAFGVLQVYFPGQFQPAVSSAITGQRDYIEGLKIVLDDGTSTLRPMGLTDVPGGAAMSGLYSVIFGIGFLLDANRRLVQLAALAGIVMGFACIYLCQIRSVLVMTLFCIAAICLVTLQRGQFGRLLLLAVVVGAAIVGGFVWAAGLGGRNMVSRLESLIAENPDQVYYKNRGIFFQQTVEVYLPMYPLGAGLGRWGMMNAYLGDNSDPDSAMIWVEIQWTGWLLDGGLPLVAAYSAALFIAGLTAWRLVLDRSLGGNLWVWALIVMAYDIGVSANTFNYAWFSGQGGLEFWLLNAALFAACRGDAAAGRPRAAWPHP